MVRHIFVVAVTVSCVYIICFVDLTTANTTPNQNASTVDCPPDFFLRWEANVTSCRVCSVCPAGQETYTPCSPSGDTTCIPCAKGYFSEGGNETKCKKCTRCPAGTFVRRECSTEMDAECVPCQARTFTSRARSKKCRPCKQCPRGTQVKRTCSNVRNTRCRSCRRNQFSEHGEACRTCTSCPPGSSQTQACSKFKDVQCKPCPAGMFSPGGKVPCRPCSVCNVEQNQLSACRDDRDTVCIPCPAGLFFYNASQTCHQCASCRPGMLVSQACTETTDTLCSPCPAGTFSSRPDSSVCSNCSVCRAGRRVTAVCRAGRDTVCQRCPRGTHTSTDNQTRCLPCSLCPAGLEPKRRCTARRDTVCRKCPTGYYSPGFSFSCRRCSLCPPGRLVDKKCSRSVDTVCSTCPVGTFSEAWSSSSQCSPCKSCRVPFAVMTACTSFNNAVCGTCGKEYFIDKKTSRCARCSYCYPDNPGRGVKEDGCWRQPEQWQCRPMDSTTNLTLSDNQPPVLTFSELATQLSASTQGSQEAPEVSSMSLSETTFNIGMSIAISGTLVAMVVIILYGVFRSRYRAYHGPPACKWPPAGFKSFGQLTGVAKSGMWVVKESAGLTATSSARHSWPLVVLPWAQPSQSLTVSQSVLGNADKLRQLEERLAQRLPPRTLSLSSTQDDSYQPGPEGLTREEC